MRTGTARSIIRTGWSPAGNLKRVFSFFVATSTTNTSSLAGQATNIVIPFCEGTIQYGPPPTGIRAICFGGSTVTSNAYVVLCAVSFVQTSLPPLPMAMP